MDKNVLIAKLYEIQNLLDVVGDKIEDIMSTPVEDLDNLINGHYGSLSRPKEDGMLDQCIKAQDLTSNLIDDLEEELEESENENERD